MAEPYRVRPKVMPFNWLTSELTEKTARKAAKAESMNWSAVVVVGVMSGKVIATYVNGKDVS